MKVVFTIIILVHIGIFQMNAQKANIPYVQASAIGLELGVNQTTLLDKSFSDLKFGGNLFKFGFLFLKENNNNYWESNLTIHTGNINYQNELYDSQLLSAELKLQYGRLIASTTPQKYFLGAKLRSNVMIINHNGFNGGSWMTNEILDITFRVHLLLKEKHKLQIGCAYPLVGFIARPPYAGVDKFVSDNALMIQKVIFGRSQFKTGLSYFNPVLNIRYIKDWRRLKLMVEIEESYLSYQAARNIKKNDLSLSLGILYNFGKNEK